MPDPVVIDASDWLAIKFGAGLLSLDPGVRDVMRKERIPDAMGSV